MYSISEKLDVVLQGPYEDFTYEIIINYLELPFVNKIILSTWSSKLLTTIRDFKGRVEIILNDYPDTPGVDNRNLQIVTSLNGLKKSTTPYSVKMRTDQRYSNSSMCVMYDFYNQHNSVQSDLIFVPGIYPDLLFHPRDHVFWGKTESLIKLFDIPLEVNELTSKEFISKEDLWKYYDQFIRVETYLGAYYCSRFDQRIEKFLLHPETYLYDNAPKWREAYTVSREVTGKYFKSFPRAGIKLIWPKKNMYEYPYDSQRVGYGERWHEDGY